MYFLQTSDHDLVTPDEQHSFNKHESEAEDNVTEPSSQEQEFKVCLVIDTHALHNHANIFAYVGFE